MNVKQKLAILFYLKRKKIDKDGKIPIYVRVTIDGLKEELSLGSKVEGSAWNSETKSIRPTDPHHKLLNKRLGQVKADLERHFDFMQVKHQVATPKLVLESYKTPLNGQRIRQEKIENLDLSEQIETCINSFIIYNGRYHNAYRDGRVPTPVKCHLLKLKKDQLDKEIQHVARKSNSIFDKKAHNKTFILAVDEQLLNFLQLAAVGHRSPNTLEKMIGRKRRFLEFLEYRYKVIDLPLQSMEYNFVEHLFNYLIVQKKVSENTAMKYVQCVKEIIDRAVSKGWLATNLFTIFKCRYTDPHHDWLTMQELERLQDHVFSNEKLNIIRDIFLFCSFTGLSFQEVYTLSSSDIITGIDKKKWISKTRQKTNGDETLPLLPLPLQLLDKYKDHPVCIVRNKLLPVPSNPEYNRCLKVIADITGIGIVLRTHKARYFFANEVTYNNGVPLKTISRMLGQKSVKTTEIYVRANRQNISDHMDMVEKKLFTPGGSLKTNTKSQTSLAKLVYLKTV